jgi:hypothetical protein
MRLGIAGLDDDFFSTSSALDLDGDGAPDRFVNGGADATESTEFVYVMRGACGHFVGRVTNGGRPTTPSTIANGLLDLESTSPCRRGCCETETVTRWIFDGRAYRAQPSTQRTVDCTRDPF